MPAKRKSSPQAQTGIIDYNIDLEDFRKMSDKDKERVSASVLDGFLRGVRNEWSEQAAAQFGGNPESWGRFYDRFGANMMQHEISRVWPALDKLLLVLENPDAESDSDPDLVRLWDRFYATLDRLDQMASLVPAHYLKEPSPH